MKTEKVALDSVIAKWKKNFERAIEDDEYMRSLGRTTGGTSIRRYYMEQIVIDLENLKAEIEEDKNV